MTDAALTHDADARARKNVLILAITGAILGSQMPIHFVLGGLSGQILAENKAWATLPISATVAMSMFAAPALAMFMARYGRRPGLLIGAIVGAIGASVSAASLYYDSFYMLLCGSALTGVYMATQGQLRFAAADTATPTFRPVAISLVTAGGLVSAVLGPQIANFLGDALAPIPFAGAYVAVVGLTLIAVPILLFLDIPVPKKPAAGDAPTRSLGEIFAQPRVRTAVVCAMVSYALMNLVMTATPLAIVGCGFATAVAGNVVMAHVLAMFAPSFYTGHLIRRFGAERIVAIGLGLLALTAVVAMAGETQVHFYAALILLGVGWNFGFIGATDMLTSAIRPEERGKAQGFNDFCVFGMVTIASLSSGALLNGFGDVVTGWRAVNIAEAPFLALAFGMLIWLWLRQRAGRI